MDMKLLNAEHLTRYTLKYEGKTYIRMHEKPVLDETSVTWLLIEEGVPYVLGDTESEKLEPLFLQIIQ